MLVCLGIFLTKFPMFTSTMTSTFTSGSLVSVSLPYIVAYLNAERVVRVSS
jgi:hypothetical protein